MFVTNHVLMGVLVAQEVPAQPVLACVLAFASHFLIDMIPHGDTELYRGYINGNKRRWAIIATTLDAIVAMAITVFLLLQIAADRRLLTFMILLISAAPDIIVGIHEVIPTRISAWFHRLHFFFHDLISRRTRDVSYVAGLGIEFALIAVVVWRLVAV